MSSAMFSSWNQACRAPAASSRQSARRPSSVPNALAARSRSRTATAMWSRASIMASRDLAQRLQQAGIALQIACGLPGQVRDARLKHVAGRGLALQLQEDGERESPAPFREITAALRAPAVAAGEVVALELEGR